MEVDDEITKSQERVMSTLRDHENKIFMHSTCSFSAEIPVDSFKSYNIILKYDRFDLYDYDSLKIAENLLCEFYQNHLDLLSEFNLRDLLLVNLAKPVFRIIYCIMTNNPPSQSSYVLK
jgi:hypothetical protein